MRKRVASAVAGVAIAGALAALPATAPAAAMWITHPDAGTSTPIAINFKRDVELDAAVATYPVQVSADNRFVLYVNGRRVGTGPATSDLAHWRFEQFDLAPMLHPGHNVISAVVWNFVKPDGALPPSISESERMGAVYRAAREQTGPAAQISAHTGFWFSASADAAVDSDEQWQASIDGRHTAEPAMAQIKRGYYVAGAAESIDARRAQSPWTAAVPVLAPPQESPWRLSADPLPPMAYRATASGLVVRTNLAHGKRFPARAVTVPAGAHVHLLLQRDAMVSAYPELLTAGGRDATITLTYAEALYDSSDKKGVRDAVSGRAAWGLTDRFIADGTRRTFAPYWWRTWRFIDIDIQTAAEPLRLEGFRSFETGYPFVPIGRFESDDTELNTIWRIGWRTARIDAHETYMDSAYWEQLQYVGDTRLQMLISYAVSGDTRLPVQAMDAFGASAADQGLTQGAYPSRNDNVIPPFSLLWIGMLHDYWWQQPDSAPLLRNLSRMREILNWYSSYLQDDGLLGKNPHWNFIDWAVKDGHSLSQDTFPSFDAKGESCLTSLVFLGALAQAADLEQALGDAAIADSDTRLAQRLREGIRQACWEPARGLFADDSSKQNFSQQANALAVLYDVATADEGSAILAKVTSIGVDAPPSIASSSYYFAWYLIRAHEHAGLADRYLDLLSTWRDLLKWNFTSWPEQRGNSRSDTHAWSAHPTADLLGIVAGVEPAAPGYRRVRIAPHLGGLTRLTAVAATPHGPIEVRYRIHAGKLAVHIHKPASLPGDFLWQGRAYTLSDSDTRMTLDR
jgi:alpha-L-rhamnosidase